MKGRRAPELAAGEFHSLVQRWLTFEAAEIFSISSDLPLDQRNIVVQDWEIAKQHLSFSITSKFSFAKHIPFLLAGMAHYDEDPV